MLDADGGQRDLAGSSAGLEQALAVAYSRLNRHECTRAEMRAHLERKGIDPQDVERSVTALVAAGQLDDARFVRLFVQDKRELKEWGRERIRRVLLERGVDRDLIEDGLAEDDSGGELERAAELLRRRFPSPPRDRRDRERALGILARKGYDVELALDAIAAHAGGTHTGGTHLELPDGTLG
jgi:regulatory protein